ncbi:MAG: PrgI family protein [Candidatus Doudnabacteria bacterium]|nr:PrgI family protein [Candidatus Doudnabacteria bacterium]
MQFPVPQFTDVEDRLIANLTLRQFGILFGTGVVIFLVFSGTKNIFLTALVFLLVGLPALAIAFLKVNGRPLYRTFTHLVKFFIQPRQMLFHKQGLDAFELRTFKSVQPATPPPVVPQEHKTIEEVSAQLKQQRQQEQQLIDSTLSQQTKKQ